MLNIKERVLRVTRGEESGFTILEYVAGAVIVVGVLWAGMEAIGSNMSVLLGNISTWASDRATSIAPGP